jgi:hypothetical protein
MIINLCPVRSDLELQVIKVGSTLTINGEVFDFSVIPDGATLPAEAVSSDFVIGEVKRVAGELELTILMPHGAAATEAARFPQPIIDPEDGPLEFPV